jgi:hypothetical protein
MGGGRGEIRDTNRIGKFLFFMGWDQLVYDLVSMHGFTKVNLEDLLSDR